MIDLSRYEAFDKELHKKFGDKYIGPTQKQIFEPVTLIPAGTLCLNRMLGGGIPEGRILELYGPFSVGKSSVAAHLTAGMQRLGKTCMWVDAERAFDPTYAAMCGVDLQHLAKFEPDTANEALEGVRIAAKTGLIQFVVLDSVAALVPSDEYEKEVGGGMIGSQARLMSQCLKQLVNYAAANRCTILFLNQERASNLTSNYGPKTTTAGGNALNYYSSVRIRLSKVADKEKNGERLGISVKAETTKNKTHTPWRRSEFDILYPYEHEGIMYAGVDVIKDVLDCAVEFDIVKKSGAWYQYEEIKVQGLDSFRTYLQDNELLFSQITELVRQKFAENNIKS